mgnify:CR=1 FL=1
MTRLDIFSDPICPWCLIGKTHLDRALTTRPDHPFEIRWHPFQLKPDMPKGGMDRQTYLEDKFGGADGAAQTYGRIAETAAALGLDLDLDAITRTPDTTDAHRLIHWAEVEGVQDAVVDGLFTAYFREGRDIGRMEVLADIADTAGLDAAIVARLLITDEDIDEVRGRDAAAREMGITAAPTFIVAGQHAVPGAQDQALWEKVIAEIAGPAA